MLYLTGVYALNIPTTEDTCGDWHRGTLNWNNAVFKESSDSIWGNYGIVTDQYVAELDKKCAVANTIRALLDLIYDGQFSYAQGMKDNFVCNNKYTNEIFTKVYMLKKLSNWNDIDLFMQKEYFMKWVNFINE